MHVQVRGMAAREHLTAARAVLGDNERSKLELPGFLVLVFLFLYMTNYFTSMFITFPVEMKGDDGEGSMTLSVRKSN